MRRLVALLLLCTALGAGPARAADACGNPPLPQIPPQRVVVVHQQAIEILLALSLEDRIAAAGYLDDALPPDLQTGFDRIPIRFDRYLATEAVAGLLPDLVLGGFAAAFGAGGLGPRETFAGLGIPTHVLASGCMTAGDDPVATAIADIRQMGALFDRRQRADALVAEIEAGLEALQPGPALTVFIYDGGEKAPYTIGRDGLLTRLLARGGARNVFDDTPGRWATVSWEAVLARDPDLILLVGTTADPAAEKRRRLEADPALAGLRALQTGHVATIPFSETVAGIRTGTAARHLARILAAARQSAADAPLAGDAPSPHNIP
ncbi:ABC transporter substrate-binding protein [Tistrella mobilis]|uniref:Periplasmic binding protein n=1 Tax=Tistrella mobilis (strain KA081020-065) TaxID=1110502 RepID=I3TPB3_TISMK|nr:ABC transporter substrate-binding protein [Tistrella mobilis]AFK54601.1 periplasmic binding protein [Tistrella mobilis KA081020-065]